MSFPGSSSAFGPLGGLIVSFLLALATGAEAVELDQIDDFQAPGTAGWSAGLNHPLPPVNVATGGPSGAGDAYLQLRATGVSQGGRLAAFNAGQWSGDYAFEGVTRLGLFIIVLSGGDVFLPATTLASVSRLRRLHAAALPGLGPGGGARGEFIATTLGVDEITALPEPSIASLRAAGLLALVALRDGARWRRARQTM